MKKKRVKDVSYDINMKYDIIELNIAYNLRYAMKDTKHVYIVAWNIKQQHEMGKKNIKSRLFTIF